MTNPPDRVWAVVASDGGLSSVHIIEAYATDAAEWYEQSNPRTAFDVHEYRLRAEVERLRAACSRENDTISQVLGRALDYPRFVDDQKNFPGSTDADGVCVGDHVAASLADEAAGTIRALRAEVERLRGSLRRAPDAIERLANLVDALDGAFISSWQSTAAWQSQLDSAREFLAEIDAARAAQEGQG